MTFNFGSAASFYSAGRHPRLLAGPKDLEAMRRRASSGRGKRIAQALRSWIDPVTDKMLAAADDKGAFEVVKGAGFGTPFVWRVDDIAVMARIDGNDRYVEAVRRALRETVREGLDGGETGYGRGSLQTVSVAYDMLCDHLPESERTRIIEWFLKCSIHATLNRYRESYFRRAGQNIGACAVMSATMSTLAIMGDPGVPDLTSELATLTHMFDATLNTYAGRDGYPWEDIGYGTSMAAYLVFVVESLRRAGVYDAYTACPRWAKFARSILHFIQPHGEHLTLTGDGAEWFHERLFILARQAAQTRDATTLWLLGRIPIADKWLAKSRPGARRSGGNADGLPGKWPHTPDLEIAPGYFIPTTWFGLRILDDLKKPVHPAKANVPTHFVDRDRGLVSFRSGWGDEDTYVTFDGSQRSPSNQGHDHASCGHFSLTALGDYFSIDTGRYNIEQNCHSVVLIDGKSGHTNNGEWTMSWQAGRLIGYRPGKLVDTAAVDSSHQHNCYWAQRTLALVKGPKVVPYVWIVDDMNKANDLAEFWWQMHTSPENTIELRENGATVTGWRNGNQLDVHFALPSGEGFPVPHTLTMDQDEVTPSSYKYITNPRERAANDFKRPADQLQTAIFLRPRLLAKVRGYNGRFMSLLLPRKKASAAPKVERLAGIANTLAVTITWPTVQDTVIWAYEHQMLEAGDVVGRGDWCVIRRTRGGKVIAYEVGDGRSLTVAGKKLAVNK